MFTCCCVLDSFESNSTVCSIFSCRNDFVTFFKFEFVFTSFKSFTIQDFSSRDSFTCFSCFISVGEGWVVTCNSCNKFSFPVIGNVHCYIVSGFIVCHTCFATCFFRDSVSVATCFVVLNFFESNRTVCSIFSCSDYFVTFFKFKLIFTSFKGFTIQDFSSLNSFTCFSCFIGIGEGWVVTCNSCNKLTLAVICNVYCHFMCSSVVCHTCFATCFF